MRGVVGFGGKVIISAVCLSRIFALFGHAWVSYLPYDWSASIYVPDDFAAVLSGSLSMVLTLHG